MASGDLLAGYFLVSQNYSQTSKEIESARRARISVIKKGSFVETVIGEMTVLGEP